MASPAIVWLRRDLRLTDNPALAQARHLGGPVLPVFVWAPEEDGAWPPGGAGRFWLHHALADLERTLRAKGSRLIIRRGPSVSTLEGLVRETGAGALLWNRLYEPAARARDALVEGALRAQGVHVRTFNACLLHEPGTVHTRQGEAFKVFTPFWRALAALDVPEPIPPPARIPAPGRWPASLSLTALALLPQMDWASGIREMWTPGEASAQARLAHFIEEALASYPADRDRPDMPGTSRLSPHLHFGEISPRQVWHAIQTHSAVTASAGGIRGAEGYLRQLAWREFASHMLAHFPHTAEAPWREAFARFPWQRAHQSLEAWQRGRTGYPIVDAGLRELWHTGWMHNRVRMIVASFLTKDLRVHWLEGARWFWDTLVDADLANNTFGWQWVAGCGADAAPYFRIFNPVLQGEKFDPTGAYVRQWVPELEAWPARWIHRPWEAPSEVRARAEKRPDAPYPARCVDHASARAQALAAYGMIGARQAPAAPYAPDAKRARRRKNAR